MLPKLFERFLHHQVVLNRSQNTISAYRQNLILFCRYFNFANDVSAADLGKVSPSDFYEFMGSLKSKNGKSLSPASIQQIMATIKIFYEYLMELKMISENPARNIKTPTKAKTLPKFLNEQQMIDLLRSVDKTNSRYPERDYAILMLFLSTGIRRSELMGINTEDISDGALLVRGKGNKERSIPLTPNSIAAVNKYLTVKQNSDGNALFVNENNSRVGESCIAHLVKKYLKEIGKSDLSTHKLRHSCLSNWVSNGTDMRTVQELAGHTNLATTMIYLHADKTQKKKAVMNTALANL